jgi:hypothetical protein
MMSWGEYKLAVSKIQTHTGNARFFFNSFLFLFHFFENKDNLKKN